MAAPRLRRLRSPQRHRCVSGAGRSLSFGGTEASAHGAPAAPLTARPRSPWPRPTDDSGLAAAMWTAAQGAGGRGRRGRRPRAGAALSSRSRPRWPRSALCGVRAPGPGAASRGLVGSLPGKHSPLRNKSALERPFGARAAAGGASCPEAPSDCSGRSGLAVSPFESELRNLKRTRVRVRPGVRADRSGGRTRLADRSAARLHDLHSLSIGTNK